MPVDKYLIERVIKAYIQIGLNESTAVYKNNSFYWEGKRDLAAYN